MPSFEELLADLVAHMSPTQRQSTAVAVDPMANINQSFGPPTDATRAGVPNAELTQGPPTAGEQAVNAMANYGPVPAQMATSMAMQPVRAGEAIGDAAWDPTLANVTNAGYQTAATFGRLPAAAGIWAGGMAEGVRRDLGIKYPWESSEAEADAGGVAGLNAEQSKLYKRLQPRVLRGSATDGQIEQYNRLDAIVTDEQRRANAAAGNLDTTAKTTDLSNRQAAIERAGRVRSEIEARDKRFSDTETGKVFDKTGGAAAFLAPFALGIPQGITRRVLGGVPFKGSPSEIAIKDVALPALEGTMAAYGANSVPSYYNYYGTQPDNQQKRALEAYVRELPEGHPDIAKYNAMIPNMPEANPVHEQASKELELGNTMRRLGISALEGAPSFMAGQNAGWLGSHLTGKAGEGIYNAMAAPFRRGGGPSGGGSGSGGGQTGSGTGGGGGTGGQGSSAPGSTTTGHRSYRPYTNLPPQDRANIQGNYMASRKQAGGDLPITRTASELKDAAASAGVDVPITPTRVKETQAAIADFVAREGREPRTKAEWSKIWSSKTLAVPLAAGAGAGAAYNATQTEEPTEQTPYGHRDRATGRWTTGQQ